MLLTKQKKKAYTASWFTAMDKPEELPDCPTCTVRNNHNLHFEPLTE